MPAIKKQTRYGIGEWYGADFTSLDAVQRREFSTAKVKQLQCPFRGVPCNKAGGVCSLRLYSSSGEGVATAGPLVTTCPQRFHEDDAALRWVARTLIGTETPSVIKELPFLKSAGDSDEGADAVGKVDMVLVNHHAGGISWCCVEMQAVYFSGPGMSAEFAALQRWEGPGILFPQEIRRPDFRSSGPKRLMPQLQIKVPTISRWGKKMAVIVDREFWNSLGKMTEVPHLSNCDVAWFVVDYRLEGNRWRLVPGEVHFTTLDRAVEGLTGGTPVSLDEFEGRILKKLGQPSSGRAR